MAASFLHELFDRPRPDSRLTWFCEPVNWTVDEAACCLNVRPEGETDFWQQTHYGFRADNGHFLFVPVAGDFVATTHVRFSPAHQYDQAGLMVRLSSTCWVKTSVEYQAEGPSRLGAVVTNGGYSDWSTQDFPGDRRDVWLRIRREFNEYIVEASDQGCIWSQVRLARLHEDQGTSAVPCGPKAAGFLAQFSFFRIDLGRASESSGL